MIKLVDLDQVQILVLALVNWLTLDKRLLAFVFSSVGE